MQEIDSILSLQINRTFKGEQLQEEIVRHFGELKKIKDFELSVLGEEILSYTGEEILELPKINEENLYDKKIDFMSLPTKKTVSQMQVTCIQADAQNQSLEEINDKVEAFYEYCKLAIDIGIFSKEDWQKIDDSHFWANIGKENQINNAYVRNPQYKRESYSKIRETYLTQEQVKQLRETMLSNSLNKTKEGYIGNSDIEELSIKSVVQDAMAELPLRMEEYILAYQLMHGKDSKYSEKLNLLNDMVNYSKRKFLEARGICLEIPDKKSKYVSMEELE